MNIFIKAMLVRAIRTICQTAAALIPTSALLISEVDWKLIASASILAGIVSVLTSIATGLPEVKYKHDQYMSQEEPEDAEVSEDDE